MVSSNSICKSWISMLTTSFIWSFMESSFSKNTDWNFVQNSLKSKDSSLIYRNNSSASHATFLVNPWSVFENHRISLIQTVLPDRSIEIEQILIENAKIEILNWDIMCDSDFQTMWFHFTWATIRQHANWFSLVDFQNYWVLFTFAHFQATKLRGTFILSGQKLLKNAKNVEKKISKKVARRGTWKAKIQNHAQRPWKRQWNGQHSNAWNAYGVAGDNQWPQGKGERIATKSWTPWSLKMNKTRLKRL